MAKAPSPLVGYNTNIRHNGKLFHVQTEDSGVKHPHIITHLFADGGRILGTSRTDYADLVQKGEFAAELKKMMQTQHKAMLLSLRNGQYDEDLGASADATRRSSHPPESTTGVTTKVQALAGYRGLSPAELAPYLDEVAALVTTDELLALSLEELVALVTTRAGLPA